MDFLDPKKRFRQTVLLVTGYVLIGVAITIATVILLYQAYGFGLGKNGTIIQSGLLFFSSQPSPAKIYINGKLNTSQTNTRLELPAGIYNVKLTRSGYNPWQRTIEVDGGSVEHFDYPLLFPAKLTTKKIDTTYASAPELVTQSPSQQWLLIQKVDEADSFDMYDLNAPTKAPTILSLPSTVVTKATVSESWQVISWADDNTHVLLQHNYDGKIEYILLDRTDPSQSVNLSQTLANDAYTQISLDNLKYDQYYLYDATTQTLSKASLTAPTVVPVVASHVLAYQTYGTNTVLYVTADGAPTGKVEAKEQVGNKTYDINALDANTNYLLNLTDYSGTQYVAVGAGSENKVFIYQDPVAQLQATPDHVPVPEQVMQIPDPNYLSFSTNAQFIMAENGVNFAVYDVENTNGYAYVAKQPLDSPQTHAVWMDGDRLAYVSGGKLLVFDYDHTNLQTLMKTSPSYAPSFDPSYNYVYGLTNGTGTTYDLDQTSLYTATDQPKPDPST
jgi:hypothetical protein